MDVLHVTKLAIAILAGLLWAVVASHNGWLAGRERESQSHLLR